MTTTKKAASDDSQAIKDLHPTGSAETNQDALDQAKADAEVRAADPNKPVVREANPKVGGESFTYLDNVSA